MYCHEGLGDHAVMKAERCGRMTWQVGKDTLVHWYGYIGYGYIGYGYIPSLIQQQSVVTNEVTNQVADEDPWLHQSSESGEMQGSAVPDRLVSVTLRL